MKLLNVIYLRFADLFLLSSLLIACGDGQGSKANLHEAAASRPDPFSIELRNLAREMNTIPSLPDHKSVRNLIDRNGVPKPEDDYKRAQVSNGNIQKWGHDVLKVAFRARSVNENDAKPYLVALRKMLNHWAAYGHHFGDPNREPLKYGNVNLELTWFLGNVIRAANIMKDMGDTKYWPRNEQEKFKKWAQGLVTKYISFDKFQSGNSNRKASQFETTMRLAEFEGDQGKLKYLFYDQKGFLGLLTVGIKENGMIPADSCRDKYHAQFFLASALQIVELAKKNGYRYNLADNKQKVGVQRLAQALRFSAKRNMSDQKPKECRNIADTNPNYEIPFWYLAPIFFNDYKLQMTPEIKKMVDQNYRSPDRVKLAMMWGYNAIATKKGL